MTDEQNIVYTEGMLLQARIILESMIAANQERLHRGESLAYNENDFVALLDKYGVHHNALVMKLGWQQDILEYPL